VVYCGAVILQKERNTGVSVFTNRLESIRMFLSYEWYRSGK
jgi:hypothetical protein